MNKDVVSPDLESETKKDIDPAKAKEDFRSNDFEVLRTLSAKKRANLTELFDKNIGVDKKE